MDEMRDKLQPTQAENEIANKEQSLSPEEIFTPENLEKMREVMAQIICDNKEWLKEMAKK
jgi:hypothetical protein